MSRRPPGLRPWDESASTAPHERNGTMKYMLMMNTPGGGPYQVSRWPQQDLKRHIDFMKDFAKRNE